MAVPHCSIRRGKAGKGAAHARYVMGLGRYRDRDDVVLVEHSGMPAFAEGNPVKFWEAADAHERANGRAYTEVQFAIPRELVERGEQLEFARAFRDEILQGRFPAMLAVHDTVARDGGSNVHGHLMLSERELDGFERGAEHFFKRADSKKPERGGARKNRELNARGWATHVRQRYQLEVNERIVPRGAEPISMLLNKEREPEPKVGPAHPRADVDVKREERLKQVDDLRAGRAEAREIEKILQRNREEIAEIEAEIKVERERAEISAGKEKQATAERTTSQGLVEALRLSRERAVDPPASSRNLLDVLRQVEVRERAFSKKKMVLLVFGVAGAASSGQPRPRHFDLVDPAGVVLAHVAVSAGRIEIDGEDLELAARVVLEHARASGWQALSVWGSVEFKQQVRKQAAVMGIPLFDHETGRAMNIEATALTRRQASQSIESPPDDDPDIPRG